MRTRGSGNKSGNVQICFMVNRSMGKRITMVAGEMPDHRQYYQTPYTARDNWLRKVIWNALGRAGAAQCDEEPEREMDNDRLEALPRWRPLPGERIEENMTDRPPDPAVLEKRGKAFVYRLADGSFISAAQIAHNELRMGPADPDSDKDHSSDEKP